MRTRRTPDAGYSLAELLVVVAVTGFLMASVFTIFEVTQRTSQRATGSEAALVQARAVVDKIGGDFRMAGASWYYYSTPITMADSTSINFRGDIDNTLDSSYNPVVLTGGASVGTPLGAGATSMKVSDTSNIVCGTYVTLANGPIAESHLLPSSGCTSGGPTNGTVNFQGTDLPSTGFPVGSLWATSGSLDVTFIYTVENVHWVYDRPTQKLCRKINGTCPADATTWNDDTEVIADNVTNLCLMYLDYSGNNLNPNCSSVAASSLSAIRAVIISVTVKAQAGDQTVTRQMQLTARSRTMVP